MEHHLTLKGLVTDQYRIPSTQGQVHHIQEVRPHIQKDLHHIQEDLHHFQEVLCHTQVDLHHTKKVQPHTQEQHPTQATPLFLEHNHTLASTHLEASLLCVELQVHVTVVLTLTIEFKVKNFFLVGQLLQVSQWTLPQLVKWL